MCVSLSLFRFLKRRLYVPPRARSHISREKRGNLDLCTAALSLSLPFLLHVREYVYSLNCATRLGDDAVAFGGGFFLFVQYNLSEPRDRSLRNIRVFVAVEFRQSVRKRCSLRRALFLFRCIPSWTTSGACRRAAELLLGNERASDIFHCEDRERTICSTSSTIGRAVLYYVDDSRNLWWNSVRGVELDFFRGESRLVLIYGARGGRVRRSFADCFKMTV